MTVPGWFQRALKAEFDGRYRVRWSPRRNCFQVEQKHARAKLANSPVNPLDDEAIRRNDGYYLVMEIAPGDRVPCPKCGATTHIPVMQLKEAKCGRCNKAFLASHWPLSDALLTHLRTYDPDRGGIDRAFQGTDRGEELREYRRRRQLRNHTEEVWKDGFNHVFDIQSVGYTGKESMHP